MVSTPRQPKLTNNEEDTTQNIAYWMGRVDASISEIKTAIDGFAKKDDSRWSEFEKWRREVDERLQRGTARFEDHARQLDELKSEIEEAKANGKPVESVKKFGSWDWFRDSYLEKLVLIILTILVYKIVDIVIAHWSITP